MSKTDNTLCITWAHKNIMIENDLGIIKLIYEFRLKKLLSQAKMSALQDEIETKMQEELATCTEMIELIDEANKILKRTLKGQDEGANIYVTDCSLEKKSKAS